jgi:hypothetical protein
MNQPFSSWQIEAAHRRRRAALQSRVDEERKLVDFSQMPLCQEAADYHAWIEEVVSAAARKPSYDVLDRALLAVLKEYKYRRESVQNHQWAHRCIPAVFEWWIERLTYLQQELYRHKFLDPTPPDVSRIPEKDLHIGETEEP